MWDSMCSSHFQLSNKLFYHLKLYFIFTLHTGSHLFKGYVDTWKGYKSVKNGFSSPVSQSPFFLDWRDVVHRKVNSKLEKLSPLKKKMAKHLPHISIPLKVLYGRAIAQAVLCIICLVIIFGVTNLYTSLN